MQQIYIKSYFKKYNKVLEYNSLINNSKWEVIEKRLKVIEFFEKWGKEARREAFGVARATVYLWKKKLIESKGDVKSLAPLSKAPKKKRERKVRKEIIEFIVRYREEHPGIGQVAIKYALDEYCNNLGIKSISTSTVARILKDLKKKGVIDDLRTKLRINGRSGKLHEVKRKRRKKLRRKGYEPEREGDLVQMDSITIFKDGIKRYIISAIDFKSEMAFA